MDGQSQNQYAPHFFKVGSIKMGKSGAGIKMMKKRSGDMIQYFSIKTSVVGFISLLIEGQRSLISDVGLKSLLHQGLSEPEFYGDLVYKFKKMRGMTDYSDKFRKIIMRYKRIGYNLNVMRQSACLVINSITVDGYAALFNCTPVDRASDSMMAPTT